MSTIVSDITYSIEFTNNHPLHGDCYFVRRVVRVGAKLTTERLRDGVRVRIFFTKTRALQIIRDLASKDKAAATRLGLAVVVNYDEFGEARVECAA